LDDRVQECKKFDLIYYDQLYNQNDKIILTVDLTKSEHVASNLTMFKNPKNDPDNDDLTPTIELVMKTRWGYLMTVDWNGSEPILWKKLILIYFKTKFLITDIIP